MCATSNGRLNEPLQAVAFIIRPSNRCTRTVLQFPMCLHVTLRMCCLNNTGEPTHSTPSPC